MGRMNGPSLPRDVAHERKSLVGEILFPCIARSVGLSHSTAPFTQFRGRLEEEEEEEEGEGRRTSGQFEELVGPESSVKATPAAQNLKKKSSSKKPKPKVKKLSIEECLGEVRFTTH